MSRGGDSPGGDRGTVELRVTPDRYLPHRYAGASGDFNPIHIDREFAESVGLPGAILHGLYVMSQVARAATDAAGGDPRALKRLSVQFRGMSLPEKEIVITGRPAGDGPGEDGLEEIALEAIQDGTRVIRNATARIKQSRDRARAGGRPGGGPGRDRGA